MNAEKYKSNLEAFNKRSAMDLFKKKSNADDLPIWVGIGSSSHHPEREGGITTCDIKVWMKCFGSDWFHPYGGFSASQVMEMISVCHSDQQILAICQLFGATNE